MPLVRFQIDAPRAVAALVFGMVWLAVLIVVLDVGLHHGGVLGDDLGGWFDGASERGLGSFVSVMQTALLALTTWGVVALARATGAPRARVWGWTLLAAAFSYLALDDGTMLHERVGSAFADTSASETSAFPSYYWQLLLGPVFAALGLFMAAFLWRELPRRQWVRVVGALALLAVAVALDFVDGLSLLHPANPTGPIAAALGMADPTLGMDAPALVTHIARVVEESLEIVAMTLLWSAILGHLPSVAAGVRVCWAPDVAPALGGDGAARGAAPVWEEAA
ncbi:hypothetical protein [Rubrivirga sp. IMCC43871]|uniref:hypothetical protein n=1 Tax=Rubrivirga sp. IMCC43871 TaxID=3391575 RepID=UPI00398FDFDC